MSVNFEDLKGKVIKKIEGSEQSYELLFITECDITYRMTHHQDCCESVTIESIVGDLEDLIGYEILNAEEVSNSNSDVNSDSSETWTFYKLATRKGYVDIRWYGTSNGYYSESVSFEKI